MRRGYIVSKRAYYGRAISEPEVIFGTLGEEGGIAENIVRWVDIGGCRCPQLQIFGEVWGDLHNHVDVIEVLDESVKTISDFLDILDTCGFIDVTKYYDVELLKAREERLVKELAIVRCALEEVAR